MNGSLAHFTFLRKAAERDCPGQSQSISSLHAPTPQPHRYIRRRGGDCCGASIGLFDRPVLRCLRPVPSLSSVRRALAFAAFLLLPCSAGWCAGGWTRQGGHHERAGSMWRCAAQAAYGVFFSSLGFVRLAVVTDPSNQRAAKRATDDDSNPTCAYMSIEHRPPCPPTTTTQHRSSRQARGKPARGDKWTHPSRHHHHPQRARQRPLLPPRRRSRRRRRV